MDVPKAGTILDLKKEIFKVLGEGEGKGEEEGEGEGEGEGMGLGGVEELFVVELYGCRFFKEFCDEDLLHPIRKGDKIYVYQIEKQERVEGEEEEEEEEPGF